MHQIQVDHLVGTTLVGSDCLCHIGCGKFRMQVSMENKVCTVRFGQDGTTLIGHLPMDIRRLSVVLEHDLVSVAGVHLLDRDSGRGVCQE